MAQFFPYFENDSLTEQFKTLPNDELLDFWEETQFLDEYMDKEFEPTISFSMEYEKAVLQELQLRSCMGRLDMR